MQESAVEWSELRSRVTPFSRADLLRLVVGLSADVPGNIVEFGVAKGHSTRVIQAALEGNGFGRRIARSIRTSAATRSVLPESLASTPFLRPRGTKQIFACDSFEGLSEPFENAEIGTFACDPPVIPGVEIVVGFFEDSLTDELARRVGSVSFASLDADLYSSTKCALDWLTPLLHSGSLLLFDEFIGENESEKRAFTEWSADTGVKTVLLGEFLRGPSGWGESSDMRALFQVVGDELPRPVQRRSRARRVLRGAKRKIGSRARQG